MAFIRFTYSIDTGGIGVVPALKLQVGDEITDGLGQHIVSKIHAAVLVDEPLPQWASEVLSIKHVESVRLPTVSDMEIFLEEDLRSDEE